MANTKQAKKRARQAVAQRGRNAAAKSKFRTALKRVLAAIATKDKAKAREAYLAAVPVIDGAVPKGLMHKSSWARSSCRTWCTPSSARAASRRRTRARSPRR